jgi:hypothetical protein
MKLNLSKFHKVLSQKDHSILKHEDGHEMKIMHKALSKANRKDLESMPTMEGGNPKLEQSKMADGGPVLSDDEIIAKKKEVDDYNKLHEDEPKEYPQEVEAKMQKTDITPRQKFADGTDDAEPTGMQKLASSLKSAWGGGDSESKSSPAPKSQPSNPPAKSHDQRSDSSDPRLKAISGMASGFSEGGEVSCEHCGHPVKKASGGVIPQDPMVHMHDKPSHLIKKTSVGEIKRKMYADGGDAESNLPPVPAVAQQDQSNNIDYSSMPETSSEPIKIATSPEQLEDKKSATVDQPLTQVPEIPQVPAKMPAQQATPLAAIEDPITKMYSAQYTAQANLAKKLEEAQKSYETDRKALTSWIDSNPVDANRYMGKFDTGQKILSTIALMAGGVSQAFTGHNPAMEFINKQIDNDIEAQKANLGVKQNMLSALNDHYKDTNVATSQLKAIMMEKAMSEMQKALSIAKTPQQQQNLVQGISAMNQQLQPFVQQNALRSILNKQAQSGEALDPMDYARLGALPPEQASKEQASVDKQRNTVGQINQLYDQLAKQQTLGNRVLNPLQSKARIGALNSQLTNLIMDADVSKRLTPESAKLEVHPNEVNLTDDEKTIATKRKNLLAIAKQKASGGAPFTEKYSPQSLPDYSGMKPMEKALLQAALSNPNHPNSAAIIKKYGSQQ